MKLKYQLDAKIPVQENLLYAFQQVVLFVASAVVMPVVVSYTLGLSQTEVAATLQRTFVLCGVMTLLQLKWGHRFPIQDGPAGLWSGLMIAMAATLPALGKTLPVLRTDLETGMMIGGAFVMLLAITGAINRLGRLFTPLINGLLILLMVLQISASIMRGMLGVSDDHPAISAKTFGISLFTMVVILLIHAYCKGFIRSIATFIGMVAGWVLAALTGETTAGAYDQVPVISLPQLFAWGRPTFDLGVVITCTIAATVLLSMAFASISGMGETVGEQITEKKMRATVGFHGLSAFMTGAFSSIAFMPYVSSIGVVQMTAVAARSPLYIAAVCMIAMGLVGPVGVFFSTIPTSVGNGALIMIFALCIGQALKEFNKVEFENRENLVVGLTMIIGVGVMFLPTEIFYGLPAVASCLLSNGLIVGMIAAFLLEHVILRKTETTE